VAQAAARTRALYATFCGIEFHVGELQKLKA
jgi:hypothetical protein